MLKKYLLGKCKEERWILGLVLKPDTGNLERVVLTDPFVSWKYPAESIVSSAENALSNRYFLLCLVQKYYQVR